MDFTDLYISQGSVVTG